MKKRALLSVSDKSGIVEFAKALADMEYEIISTGGTKKALEDANIAVTGVDEITGFPECLDGRVKTLHPAVSAGILAVRSNKEHINQLEKLNINTIDIVAVNFYPFKATILKENISLQEAVENIDIGGPTMIRSAAKNWRDVAAIVDPADYGAVIDELRKNGCISLEHRLKLSAKVFEHTSHYDTLISHYLKKQTGGENFPSLLTVTFEKAQQMRYGENPHQTAAFYKEIGEKTGTISAAKQLHGKELSYNNISDSNAAVELLKEFGQTPCAVAVKHANPCGVGIGENILEAYKNAYDADPVSIYGGILAFNQEVDKETAREISKIFLEIIIAPSFSPDAMEILIQKKNIRLMELKNITKPTREGTLEFKKVAGGLLVQTYDTKLYDKESLTVVTKKAPSDEQLKQLEFAMKVVKHTKSNAIVLANKNQTVGIGPGQTNRVTSLNIAICYAGEKAKGAVMASDAFLPFSDCVEAAHKAGIEAIIQPGGSIRDEDSIKACDKFGISMIFTKTRHFKH